MSNAVSLLTEVPDTPIRKRFVGLVSFTAALGGLLFGFDTAVISGAIPYLSAYFHLDDYGLGWAVGSILLGCALGAVMAGMISDRYGRKFALIICAILFAVSGVGAGLSQQLGWFVIFRLLGGLGVGAASMVSPMYIAEMAPAKWRGRLVAFYQMAIVSGILLAYYSNYLFDNAGTEGWRWMFISQTAPALLFLVFLLLVPETPRWLVKKGRNTEAAVILEKIAGQDVAAQQIADITRSFHDKQTVSLKQIVTANYGRVIKVGILIAVFQQAAGINAILYYAPVIFRQTGLNSSSSLMQTIGIGAVNVMATFIAIALVDQIGRKKLLVTGSILMGLFLSLIALCFKYDYYQHYIVLVFMLLYVATFSCTLGAVTWVYLSEIFPNLIRGTALSIATLALWLADFIVSYTFPVMTKHLGTAVTLFSYAGICLAAAVYMLLYVKETKGKSLEEIEKLFTGNH